MAKKIHRIETALDQNGGKCTDRYGLIEDFGKPSQSKETNVTEYPCRLKVRDGGIINHPWFGPIVNDFAGMEWHKERLTLDWSHDNDEEIGVIDKNDSATGDLICDARLFSRNESDRAAKIRDYSEVGMPYEVSMTWGKTQDGRFVVEDLPTGKSAKVNDREIYGPVAIIRVWGMYGAAICNHGVDSSTTANFQDSEGKNMSKDLKVFIDKFGNDAAVRYMLDESVTSVEDAEALFQKEQVEALTKDNAKLVEENKTLGEQLKTVTDANEKLTQENAKLTEDFKRVGDELVKYQQALPGTSVTDAKTDSSNREDAGKPAKNSYRDSMTGYFASEKK